MWLLVGTLLCTVPGIVLEQHTPAKRGLKAQDTSKAKGPQLGLAPGFTSELAKIVESLFSSSMACSKFGPILKVKSETFTGTSFYQCNSSSTLLSKKNSVAFRHWKVKVHWLIVSALTSRVKSSWLMTLEELMLRNYYSSAIYLHISMQFQQIQRHSRSLL